VNLREPIVAATDFSDDAGRAVLRAAMLASVHKVALELLHVVSESSLAAVREWVRTPADLADRLVQETGRLLEDCARALPVAASPRLVVGTVLEEILSSSLRASALAIGAHGQSPLHDAILGTTAERLVGRCPCPILVVRKPAGEDYRNVLVALDLLPGSENVLAAAMRIAPGARVTALHAYEVPFEGALQRAGVSTAEIGQHRADAFQRAVDRIQRMSERVLPIVEHGDAARLIVERERTLGAELIVVGKRRRAAGEELILGSVTRHVLADAQADILVLPHA
jgi:nucleotide-binding universal stress UspA family protein